MDKYCERCYLRDAKPCMECSTCNPGHRNFKPAPTPLPTNADRIRGMNDEELAGLLREVVNLDGPDYCKRLSECDALLEANVDIPDQKCYQCLIDWLRQPVEE